MMVKMAIRNNPIFYEGIEYVYYRRNIISITFML
jgi:hypothetical protein